MFSKKVKADLPLPVNLPKNAVPSIISADLRILGNLLSDGIIEIEGRLDGNITCNFATIRKGGVIKGDIIAESLQIDGVVEGLIKARHVRISETGRVTGVVMYETLSIKDGAFIDGQCKTMEPATVLLEQRSDKKDNKAKSAAEILPAKELKEIVADIKELTNANNNALHANKKAPKEELKVVQDEKKSLAEAG